MATEIDKYVFDRRFSLCFFADRRVLEDRLQTVAKGGIAQRDNRPINNVANVNVNETSAYFTKRLAI